MVSSLSQGSWSLTRDEQRVVLEMIDMRDAGSSLRDIATHLNASGVRAKRGGIWHPQTVARVLQATDGNQVVYE